MDFLALGALCYFWKKKRYLVCFSLHIFVNCLDNLLILNAMCDDIFSYKYHSAHLGVDMVHVRSQHWFECLAWRNDLRQSSNCASEFYLWMLKS